MTAEPNEPQNQAPWFAFWAREWLTDERMALWPLERKGALLELRCRAWLAKIPCTLPTDDASLAVLSGLGRRWKTHSEAIRSVLEERDGRLCDPYLQNLYDTMVTQHKKRADAGRRGAMRRWESVG